MDDSANVFCSESTELHPSSFEQFSACSLLWESCSGLILRHVLQSKCIHLIQFFIVKSVVCCCCFFFSTGVLGVVAWVKGYFFSFAFWNFFGFLVYIAFSYFLFLLL
jgi:hypothetical protein